MVPQRRMCPFCARSRSTARRASYGRHSRVRSGSARRRRAAAPRRAQPRPRATLRVQPYEGLDEMSRRAALPLALALACLGAASAAFTCQSTPALAVTNCAVLADLYASTRGASWTDNSGWATAATGVSTDYCTFRGVGCTGGGVIASLCVPAPVLPCCTCARTSLCKRPCRAATHGAAPMPTRLTDAPPAAQPAVAQQLDGHAAGQPWRADHADAPRPVLQRAHRHRAP